MKGQGKARHLLFAFLSAAYGSAIFLLADSPFVMSVSAFNPNSILHIPLYGILTLLLFFSIPPSKKSPNSSPAGEKDPSNPGSSPKESRLGQITSSSTGVKNRFQSRRVLIAGLFAFAVGVADELHQSTVPRREASLSDVALDLLGIVIAFGVILWLHRRKVPWFESW